MFLPSLLVGALAALATAQSNPLGFTRVPNPITVGKPQAITYMTNDDKTPVTILLRRGDSKNLQTVKILTSDATGGQYVWTPANDVENGSDYALEIRQSGNEPNYYGPFQIQGSTGAASASRTSTSSATVTAPASYNHTSTTLPATYPISAGNMTTILRNATLSHPTLTRTSSSASETAAETTGAGIQTGTAASPSQTGNSASSFAAGGSAIALVLGAVAAIVIG